MKSSEKNQSLSTFPNTDMVLMKITVSNRDNPPLKYGVKACRWSVLKKHFSQKTAISERMASVTLRMFSSLSSSRR